MLRLSRYLATRYCICTVPAVEWGLKHKNTKTAEKRQFVAKQVSKWEYSQWLKAEAASGYSITDIKVRREKEKKALIADCNFEVVQRISMQIA